MEVTKTDCRKMRLSPGMKCLIDNSAKKLRDNIYCWSLDPEDSWPDDPSKIIGRDAAAQLSTYRLKPTAAIYAFGEVTYTHTEMYEQVTSWNKEAASKKGGVEDIENTILQAAPAYRCEPISDADMSAVFRTQ